MSNPIVVRAEGLRYSVGSVPLLHGADVTCSFGSVTAIIGPNGAGKSTLLRCLALLHRPSAGRLEILGQSYSFPDEGPLVYPWPTLTFVSQAFELWPHLTLRENISEPLRARGLPSGETVDHWLDRLDLARLAGRLPSELSGGERQRGALARALALNPRILLVDEPTSASDVEHAVALAGLLKQEAAAGRTIVIVTHLMGLARTLADQVLFIDEGRITASGGVSLLDNPPSERIRRFLSVA